jgi:hypothetical protein
MCKAYGRFRIQIWISINIESLILIRIIIKMMPIHNKDRVLLSVADPGCLSRIPDPNFFLP